MSVFSKKGAWQLMLTRGVDKDSYKKLHSLWRELERNITTDGPSWELSQGNPIFSEIVCTVMNLTLKGLGDEAMILTTYFAKMRPLECGSVITSDVCPF